MSGMRDYEQWHRGYDGPDSGLAWRLRTVQHYIDEALDRHSGPMTVLSCCSGDGRDLLGVLSRRSDADRVTATLVEIHPGIAARASTAAAACAAQVEVRTADAGMSDTYLGAAPADLVIMVGIFGNISDTDLARTIAASGQLCLPGATLLWSRGRDSGDVNDIVRARFAAAGFTELDYATYDGESKTAAGAMRYDGPTQPLVGGQLWFTFRR
jgi:hypothetical protein